MFSKSNNEQSKGANIFGSLPSSTGGAGLFGPAPTRIENNMFGSNATNQSIFDIKPNFANKNLVGNKKDE
jgi:hypothetical protein